MDWIHKWYLDNNRLIDSYNLKEEKAKQAKRDSERKQVSIINGYEIYRVDTSDKYIYVLRDPGLKGISCDFGSKTSKEYAEKFILDHCDGNKTGKTWDEDNTYIIKDRSWEFL